MATKRRIEVTVETRERLIVRRHGTSPGASCHVCGDRERMVTVEEAALLNGLSVRGVVGWVEAGTLHFAETEDGLLLVCLDSLAAQPCRPTTVQGETP